VKIENWKRRSVRLKVTEDGEGKKGGRGPLRRRNDAEHENELKESNSEREVENKNVSPTWGEKKGVKRGKREEDRTKRVQRLAGGVETWSGTLKWRRSWKGTKGKNLGGAAAIKEFAT